MIMDNYRGITVTPTVSKIFETTILPLLKQDINQSSLQFGFTEELSMLMAAFIIARSSRDKNNHIGSINFNNIRQSNSRRADSIMASFQLICQVHFLPESDTFKNTSTKCCKFTRFNRCERQI